MTFKESFTASEQKAHNKLIATKILKELSELRSSADASPIAPRRWVWELIQNAKDVGSDGKVRIHIDFELAGDRPHVTFWHDGSPFSAENVRFLIEQISSKDRSKDESGRPNTTGKFGTGFLTTHLLSEVVHVNGVARELGLAPRRFELRLNRTGFDLESIIASVAEAKASLEDLDERAPCPQYDPRAYNTSFRYELDESGVRAAEAGLSDLDACLPYTLAFVRGVESVSFLGRTYSFAGEAAEDFQDGARLSIASIRRECADGTVEIREIVTLTKGLTTIAMPIVRVDSTLRLVELGEHVPRLHCDLPLIGTEAFPFPVVINCPALNPTDARDGVFLNSPLRSNPPIEENKGIVLEARDLYLRLLAHASAHGWQNLHLLAQLGPIPSELTWADAAWYKAQVLTPLRTAILRAKIVRTANGEVASILSQNGNKFMWFPSVPRRALRERLWRCGSSWFPQCLPDRSDVDFWSSNAWDECGRLTLDQFAAFVEGQRAVAELEGKVGAHVYAWLGEFYCLFEDDEASQALLRKRKVFPNQRGDLCRSVDLRPDAGDIDADLLDILFLLGKDLRAQLLHPEMEVPLEHPEPLDLAYVVKEIAAEVHSKSTDRDVARNHRDAFQRLLIWFRQHPGLASSLFPAIYRNKHLLYDEEQIIENIERAEQLTLLLAEFDVASVDELRSTLVVSRAASQLLPVTQEIITRMGISSVEEWEAALRDRDLAALFSHESTPTTDMFVYAQSIIRQAKDRVIGYLSQHPDYDLSDMDETAPTVLAGIRKSGRSIMIVVRPAYDGEVLIYYGSERDVLDFEDSELWVDDGARARRVTLGGILKTTQIRKFPV